MSIRYTVPSPDIGANRGYPGCGGSSAGRRWSRPCLPYVARSLWSKSPNSGVIPVASIPEEARENHRNGARRHHPVRPVLVAAGRSALLVERLSVALQPLPAPLLACPALSILLSAVHLRLL